MSFLSNLADIFDLLSSESRHRFNPAIGLTSAVILATATSFSNGFLTPLFIIAVSIMLGLFTGLSLRKWLPPILLILAATLAVSAPLPYVNGTISGEYVRVSAFNVPFDHGSLHSALIFTLRVVAAASIFTVFMVNIGWSGLIRGLTMLKIPKEFIYLLGLFLKSIPLILRDTTRIIAGRESRTLKRLRIKGIWYIIVSVAGDLFMRGYMRSWKLSLAMNARGFNIVHSGAEASAQIQMCLLDKLILIITSSIITLSILGNLGVIPWF
jgi:energy-coupling factor transporter transmembrane protein EcfT